MCRLGGEEKLTWSWGTGRRVREARSREEEATRGRRRRRGRAAGGAWGNGKPKPWLCWGPDFSRRDSPMLEGLSRASSRTEMAAALRFLQPFPLHSLRVSDYRSVFPLFISALLSRKFLPREEYRSPRRRVREFRSSISGSLLDQSKTFVSVSSHAFVLPILESLTTIRYALVIFYKVVQVARKMDI